MKGELKPSNRVPVFNVFHKRHSTQKSLYGMTVVRVYRILCRMGIIEPVNFQKGIIYHGRLV